MRGLYPRRQTLHLILEERPLGRVSKEASWLETALKKRLLTMREAATASADE
jgi:hypothetical protein